MERIRRPSLWTRLNRVRRRFGFDGNELRRDVDRNQHQLGVLLLVLALVIAPGLALRFGETVYDRGVRSERRDTTALRRVNVRVVAVSDTARPYRVTVDWVGSDGAHRTGSYTTWRPPGVGDRPAVWVGPGGLTPTGPHARSQTLFDAVAAGFAAALTACLPFLAIYVFARVLYDRRRYRQWDAEWASLTARRRL